MKIVKPYTSVLSDGTNNIKYFNNIISTNAVDETVAEYVASTTYNANDEVKITSLKRKYISKIDGNTDYPVNSSNWVDMGALNSWSCFDDKLFSQTITSSDLIVEIDTSRATKIALMNLTAVTEAIIETTDNSDGSIKTETISLRDYGVNNLYDYAYKPFRDKKQLLYDIEWLPSSKVKITLQTTQEIGVGMILSGIEESSGLTLWGSSIGQIDYSQINTDAWGNTSFVPRNVAKTVDAKLIIDTVEADTNMALFDDIRASLSLFIGDERDKGFESMNVFGFIKSVSIPLEVTKSEYTIKIIGVV